MSFGWTLVGSVNVAKVAAIQERHLLSVPVIIVGGGAIVGLAVSAVSSPILLFFPLEYLSGHYPPPVSLPGGPPSTGSLPPFGVCEDIPL